VPGPADYDKWFFFDNGEESAIVWFNPSTSAQFGVYEFQFKAYFALVPEVYYTSNF